MNVACDYETPMQMLTTEKYIAPPRPFQRSDPNISAQKKKKKKNLGAPGDSHR